MTAVDCGVTQVRAHLTSINYRVSPGGVKRRAGRHQVYSSTVYPTNRRETHRNVDRSRLSSTHDFIPSHRQLLLILYQRRDSTLLHSLVKLGELPHQ